MTRAVGKTTLLCTISSTTSTENVIFISILSEALQTVQTLSSPCTTVSKKSIPLPIHIYVRFDLQAIQYYRQKLLYRYFLLPPPFTLLTVFLSPMQSRQSPTLDEFRGRQIDLYRRKESLDRLTAELYLATHQEDDQKLGCHSVLNTLSGLSLQRHHHIEPTPSQKKTIAPSDILTGINDDVAEAMTLTREIIQSAEDYAEYSETHASQAPLCSILEDIASSSTRLSSIVNRLDTRLQQLITVIEDRNKREGARKKRNKSLGKVEKGCTGAAIVFAVGACIPGPQTPAFGALSALSLAVAGLCKLLKKPSGKSCSYFPSYILIDESYRICKQENGLASNT